MCVKDEAIEEFVKHTDAWMPRMVWTEDCRVCPALWYCACSEVSSRAFCRAGTKTAKSEAASLRFGYVGPILRAENVFTDNLCRLRSLDPLTTSTSRSQTLDSKTVSIASCFVPWISLIRSSSQTITRIPTRTLASRIWGWFGSLSSCALHSKLTPVACARANVPKR